MYPCEIAFKLNPKWIFFVHKTRKEEGKQRKKNQKFDEFAEEKKYYRLEWNFEHIIFTLNEIRELQTFMIGEEAYLNCINSCSRTVVQKKESPENGFEYNNVYNVKQLWRLG